MLFPAITFRQVTFIKVTYLYGDEDDDHPFQAERPLLGQVIPHQIC